MEKPSAQFVTKLENNLRTAYRAELAVKPSFWSRLPKFILPAFSGALALFIIILNLTGKGVKNSDQAAPIEEMQLATLNDTASDDAMLASFDSGELYNIDRGVQLAIADNISTR